MLPDPLCSVSTLVVPCVDAFLLLTVNTILKVTNCVIAEMKIKTVFLDVIMHSLEDIYAQKQKTTTKNPKQTNKQTTTTTTTKTHTHTYTQQNTT